MPGDGFTDEVIGLNAGFVATKGLIESADPDVNALDDADTRIKVYDYLTAGTPSVEVLYIDNSIKWKDADTDPWDYVTPATYYWTKTGTHKFFGWLTTAPDGTAFATPPTWTAGTKTLEISNLVMTPASPQFDFLYSDIISRTMNNSSADDHSYVELQFSHLFTALKVDIKADDEMDKAVVINVKSITFSEFKTKKSATISFAGTEVSPVLTNSSDDEKTFTVTKAVTLQNVAAPAQGETPAVENEPKTLFDYALLWPQLPANTTTNTPADITDATLITITYTLGSSITEETVSVPLNTAKLDETHTITQMDAGKKYYLLITMKRTSDMQFKLIVDPLVEYYYNGASGDHSDYLIKF